jgi:hypothetical protein
MHCHQRSAKRKGELAELRFMVAAAEHGLVVSHPYGDSSRYDFLTESDQRYICRVQVKSAHSPQHGGYNVHIERICPSRRRAPQVVPYTSDEIDFLVAYIAPADAWYIIPVGALPPRQTIWLCPERRRRGRPNPFEVFREAWHLLLEDSDALRSESHETQAAP